MPVEVDDQQRCHLLHLRSRASRAGRIRCLHIARRWGGPRRRCGRASPRPPAAAHDRAAAGSGGGPIALPPARVPPGDDPLTARLPAAGRPCRPCPTRDCCRPAAGDARAARPAAPPATAAGGAARPTARAAPAPPPCRPRRRRRREPRRRCAAAAWAGPRPRRAAPGATAAPRRPCPPLPLAPAAPVPAAPPRLHRLLPRRQRRCRRRAAPAPGRAAASGRACRDAALAGAAADHERQHPIRQTTCDDDHPSALATSCSCPTHVRSRDPATRFGLARSGE